MRFITTFRMTGTKSWKGRDSDYDSMKIIDLCHENRDGSS